MCEDNVMTDDPWLFRTRDATSLSCCQRAQGTSNYSRRELTQAIAEDRNTPGLVERQPMLDPVPVTFEANTGVSRIVVDNLTAEPPFVALVEGER